MGWLVESYAPSPQIAFRLDELSVTRLIDPVAPLWLAVLVEEVRPDRAGALALAVQSFDVSTRARSRGSPTSVACSSLRRIDEKWLDAVIDIVPAEPGVWDAVHAMLLASEEHRLIVARLAIERLTDAWLRHSSSSPDEGVRRWANELVSSLEEWADEEYGCCWFVAAFDD